MDFRTASKYASLLTKDYSEDFFRLLLKYKSLSASEAASRVGIHIKTAQDFLENLTKTGVVSKIEVYEKKRPYYRYELLKEEITINLSLSSLYDPSIDQILLAWKIREKEHSSVKYKVSKCGERVTAIHIFTGVGRAAKEKVINLTKSQGKFAFNLPFPTQNFVVVKELITRLKLESHYISEVFDLIRIMQGYDLIEIG